jgi:hypothetical protein
VVLKPATVLIGHGRGVAALVEKITSTEIRCRRAPVGRENRARGRVSPSWPLEIAFLAGRAAPFALNAAFASLCQRGVLAPDPSRRHLTVQADLEPDAFPAERAAFRLVREAPERTIAQLRAASPPPPGIADLRARLEARELWMTHSASPRRVSGRRSWSGLPCCSAWPRSSSESCGSGRSFSWSRCALWGLSSPCVCSAPWGNGRAAATACWSCCGCGTRPCAPPRHAARRHSRRAIWSSPSAFSGSACCTTARWPRSRSRSSRPALRRAGAAVVGAGGSCGGGGGGGGGGCGGCGGGGG